MSGVGSQTDKRASTHASSEFVPSRDALDSLVSPARTGWKIYRTLVTTELRRGIIRWHRRRGGLEVLPHLSLADHANMDDVKNLAGDVDHPFDSRTHVAVRACNA